MKKPILSRIIVLMALIAVFACKKRDEGELDRTGASSDVRTEETTEPVIDGPDSDTISAGRDGMNASGIGSGKPETSGTE